MKNFFKTVLTLFFIVILISPVYPQGNFFNYTKAGINFWYPDGWLVREHLLLLLMPKEEDLQINFQITDEVNLEEATSSSLAQLKLAYPDDTIYTIKIYTVNKMKVKEINKNIGGDKIFKLLIEAPGNKIIKVSFIAPLELALKHNAELQKIIKSLKPLD